MSTSIPVFSLHIRESPPETSSPLTPLTATEVALIHLIPERDPVLLRPRRVPLSPRKRRPQTFASGVPVFVLRLASDADWHGLLPRAAQNRSGAAERSNLETGVATMPLIPANRRPA
ncbi:MAG: hypothetical protein JRF07_08810 [Deltaproteobacteria bacterium]|nr:hypothetical protein [Deltaproteobacteria bacterium]